MFDVEQLARLHAELRVIVAAQGGRLPKLVDVSTLSAAESRNQRSREGRAMSELVKKFVDAGALRQWTIAILPEVVAALKSQQATLVEEAPWLPDFLERRERDRLALPPAYNELRGGLKELFGYVLSELDRGVDLKCVEIPEFSAGAGTGFLMACRTQTIVKLANDPKIVDVLGKPDAYTHRELSARILRRVRDEAWLAIIRNSGAWHQQAVQEQRSHYEGFVVRWLKGRLKRIAWQELQIPYSSSGEQKKRNWRRLEAAGHQTAQPSAAVKEIPFSVVVGDNGRSHDISIDQKAKRSRPPANPQDQVTADMIQIAKLHYRDNVSHAEIAARMKMSTERVQRFLEEATSLAWEAKRQRDDLE